MPETVKIPREKLDGELDEVPAEEKLPVSMQKIIFVTIVIGIVYLGYKAYKANE